MKKNIICAAAVAFVAVAFAACGNKSEAAAEATDSIDAAAVEVVEETVATPDTVATDTTVVAEVSEAPAQN